MKNWEDITPGRILIVLVIAALIMALFSGCYGTYYLTDAEYSDVRESHAAVTYYDNQIYWGWNSGYYYYYGMPHYYPWYYYYNACPPSHYHTSSHIMIKNTVNKPRHNWNKPTYKPNRNITIKPTKNNKVIINKNKNKSNRTIKPNRRKK